MLIDRLELANFVRVISPARGALIVEVPPDVIPAESANLWRDMAFMWLENKRKEEKGTGHLVLTWYSHWHGLKFRSEISISSRQRGHSLASYTEQNRYRYTINKEELFVDMFLDRTSSSLQYASCTPVRTEDFA